MRIDQFTKEQIISIVLMHKANIDYIRLLDYDWFDWLEWGDIHRS